MSEVIETKRDIKSKQADIGTQALERHNAWEQWFESDQGQACVQIPRALGPKTMKGKLRLAFEAGGAGIFDGRAEPDSHTPELGSSLVDPPPVAVIELKLPWPPTVNHYYKRTAKGQVIGEVGKKYRAIVAGELLVNWRREPLEGRLSVMVTAHAKDARKRDLDNLHKCLLDALEKGGLYENDSQIDDLRIVRGPKSETGEGYLVVRVWEYPDPKTEA